MQECFFRSKEDWRGRNRLSCFRRHAERIVCQLIRIENYAQWFEKSMSWIHSGGLKPMQASSWILGALTRAIWLFILDQEQMIVPWKEHRRCTLHSQ